MQDGLFESNSNAEREGPEALPKSASGTYLRNLCPAIPKSAR
jgi:hypothetical protein